MSAGVELVDIAKYFGQHCAVNHISLDVDAGSFFSLLGPSGCGKSTTLRIISGFESPDSGRILIGGEDVTTIAPYKRPTNMVFQRWALFPHMTVAQNIAFGLEVDGIDRPTIRSRVGEMLDLVDLSDFSERKPGQLSGGQMQRVALARALIKQPKLLLLDEPLGALDLKLRHQMQRELKQIQRQIGTTFIFVTHDQNEAVTMSDTIAVMNDGRIEQIGSPLEIYDRPQTHFVANFIGNTNMLSVHAQPSANDGVVVSHSDLSFESVSIGTPIAGPTKGHISLRYEQIKLGDDAQGLPVQIDARVVGTIFSGSVVQYELAMQGGNDLVLIAELHHDGAAPILQEGQKVKAGWSDDAPRFFADV